MTFSQGLLRRLPFSASTTPLQALTYLLGISLFSISFLVFLNSSVSFVITDLIGIKDGVGDIVGTLGFVDEIVVLIACPIWGLVSDRSGVRYVAVVGYSIIGLSLFLFVQARNVYPQLLLARILFAVGAAAVTTMVTAILPSLTDETGPAAEPPRGPVSPGGRPSVTLSVDSEATITPERFRGDSNQTSTDGEEPSIGSEGKGKSSALAGYVGLFTGCGALVALVLFLPLPARFSHVDGVTFADAIKDSFYIVGKSSPTTTSSNAPSSSASPTTTSPSATWGGFVARASTVAISLFLPLFVNTYFFSRGFCQGSPTDSSPELKKECRQAYVLSSILAGVAQLVGLVCAPLFGYLASRRTRINWPVIVSAVLGIVGYVAFPMLESPEYKDVEGRGGSPVVFLLAALMGVSQIGAIVCSLGSLGRGVLKVEVVNVLARVGGDQETLIEDADGEGDTAPLLENAATLPEDTVSRVRLKGSVAGVYSWFGGAAILLLTKLGGYLFDVWSTGAPFYLMAVFNGVLLLASIVIDVGRATGARRRHHLL
ncbi:hypothetical protein CHGG_03389 [Chaetomium globosum CBS 148.51]|uniref:Major facilitator superfamily (MFS) profile domain-containing protein n=1 Tax=Chaetomium globosum (strain ATCC 6205 / CBS 148.51 / DSM 1962 / NBRC 6347 / NRRL 1970) TaxID=306901 RepID=Q2H8R5_CHAGB|nr:uncharacterized protein CHGG_03389 [Chaetomium globosum CBS 148.51]EAQ91454.1 hypothetical protein CHGG_03389 [Chaetomium globosum CBS 148.51]